MNKNYTAAGIAWRIWILTAFLLALGIWLYVIQFGDLELVLYSVILFACVMGSIPAFLLVLVFVFFISITQNTWQSKYFKLVLLQFLITTGYGLLTAIIDPPVDQLLGNGYRFIKMAFAATMVLFACSLASSLILLKKLASYFSGSAMHALSYPQLFNLLINNTFKNNTTMETNDHGPQAQPSFQQPSYYQSSQSPQGHSNKLLIKGIITGVLILLMLIPTLFINNLIVEREQRQKAVVAEVSSKWATNQTIAGPYLVVPYNDTSTTTDGKVIVVKKQLAVLANDLHIDGRLFPEERPRSIYKVLLYRSDINITGSFKPKWPAGINTAVLDFANASLCFGISDFKGIEEEIHINYNNQDLVLSPGLPATIPGEIGLSVPVSIDLETINNGIPFTMKVKLKGSEKLHFMPLASNCKVIMRSSWNSPSFDGNSLPNEKEITQQGFTAKWNFNHANLPFRTVTRREDIKGNLAFGVSLVQPADQYDKTLRSVKYAILFIGLTFALFFIIEIMQRKPFHPVQYVLVGLALTIFYTLLLSISEYLLFDLAYLLSAAATILLIALYAQSHFGNWNTTAVFGFALSLLYGFIFILIRLEDTSLLVGSIGLFVVLALVMYASRSINWYGKEKTDPLNAEG